jgi:hypothetical protein
MGAAATASAGILTASRRHKVRVPFTQMVAMAWCLQR